MAAARRGLRFALGGGLAFAEYSGHVRNMKDLDLFILPEDREAMVEAFTEAGFTDYFSEKPYDQSWIYRGVQNGIIVDMIWTFPSHRMDVDDQWLTRGKIVDVHGMKLRLLPIEELIWSKIYVFQRDRCDWPDVLNILVLQCADLDWQYLIDRMGTDSQLLGSLLSLFRWLCPRSAKDVPDWVWDQLGLLRLDISSGCEADGARAHMLDTREWFGPKDIEKC